MAVYAALLLGYMDEGPAYWSFYHLLCGPKHKLSEFFVDDFLQLRLLNVVWDKILEIRFPKVHANLKRLKVEPMTYTPNWFLTAFQVLPFPNVFRLRVFDRYAAFGTRALLSLGIAIIKVIKADLEIVGAAKAAALLQNPATHPMLQDWRKLVRKWDRAFLSPSQYKSYFEKARVTFFP
jgi:hypothetical protein